MEMLLGNIKEQTGHKGSLVTIEVVCVLLMVLFGLTAVDKGFLEQ